MTHRQEVVLLHLIHFTATKLREQYEGREEHTKFGELLKALEDPETGASVSTEQHEQAKLPPLPTFEPLARK